MEDYHAYEEQVIKFAAAWIDDMDVWLDGPLP